MENDQTVRKTGLIKIELNDKGDYITISTDDTTLFDRFIAGYLQIANEAERVLKEHKKIEKKYRGMKGHEIAKVTDIARLDVAFSEKAIKIIDSIFGEGTLKKYFRKLYNAEPNFLPSAECFTDFFENIMPVMEKLFNRKINQNEKVRIGSMSKYMH